MKVHENNGKCEGCANKFDEYPGFNPELRYWFETLQMKYPEAHISCAWRSSIDQEVLWQRRATKARAGQSSHQYGMGADLFCNNGKDIFDERWFNEKIGPEIPDWIIWFGAPGAIWYERPHVEVRGWSQLVRDRKLMRIE